MDDYLSSEKKSPSVILGLPDVMVVSCDDISCERLVDPIPRPKPPAWTVKVRPEEQRIVFVDNRKPNSLEILRRAQRLLRARGVEVRDEIRRKPAAGEPLPDAMLEELASEKGMVLLGISD
jgi:hypothetical protein